MSYYTVDPCDLTCYGDYTPPSLANTLILAECFDQTRCADLVAQLVAAKENDSGIHDLGTGEKIDYGHRSSSWLTVDPEMYQQVSDRITFVANYHVCRQLNQKRRRCVPCEGLQFLRYDATKAGHFNRHHDDGYFANGQFQYVAPRRKLTSVTYLNADYDGGEIVLDTVKDPYGLPFTCKPQVGSTIIFPADQRFPHEVKPVTRGVRFSVVCWFDLED